MSVCTVSALRGNLVGDVQNITGEDVCAHREYQILCKVSNISCGRCGKCMFIIMTDMVLYTTLQIYAKLIAS